MSMADFWEGKVPCWLLTGCSELVRTTCPAYDNCTRPCWEIPDTACDVLLGTEKTCDVCRVYKLYGPQGETPAGGGSSEASAGQRPSGNSDCGLSGGEPEQGGADGPVSESEEHSLAAA